MSFSSARAYLLDYVENGKNIPGWLKDLIYSMTETSDNLTEDKFDLIYNELKTGAPASIQKAIHSKKVENAKIVLKNLTHNSGVAALDKGQSLDFDTKATLLYGLNGSGKSSYFKILNEACGGLIATPLKKNIYAKVAEDLSASITFEENGTLQKWELKEGYERGETSLNLVRFFNSNYNKFFLERHEAENAIIHPYGLHVFKRVTSQIDALKFRVQQELSQMKQNLPKIDVEKLTPRVRTFVEKQAFNDDEKKYVEQYYVIENGVTDAVLALENKEQELLTCDYKQKCSALNIEFNELKAIKLRISECRKNVKSLIDEVNLVSKQYASAKKSYEDAKIKFDVLNDIGNAESRSWQAFIRSGQTYLETLDGVDYCPYCRQPINADAKKIIDAYASYLSDETALKLKEVETAFESISKKIIDKITVIQIPDFLKDEFENGGRYTFDSNNINFANDYFLTQKTNLLTAVKDRNAYENYDSQEDFFRIFGESIENILTSITSDIETLNQSEVNRNKELEDVRSRLDIEKEKIYISQNKDVFVKWFDEVSEINRLTAIESKVSTKKISSLSANAYEDLLTKNLYDLFKEELKNLGLDKIALKLEMASVKKGGATLQLKLEKDEQISDVLSEGEQKGAALALFIAEQRAKKNENPIVFDDPVNSLDSKIIEKFVTRILNLKNQIVIFSHSILLLTAYENNEKLLSYEICSGGKMNKGVVKKWESRSCGEILTSIKKKIKNLENKTDICGEMRLAIERIVDEKVLGGNVPTKFNSKGSIVWEALKKAKGSVMDVDALHDVFSSISHRGLHQGVAQAENPLDYEELDDLCEKLIRITRC